MINNVEEYKIAILEIIEELLPGCKVQLFGSRARKDFSEGSDIDLAIDNGFPIDYKKIHALKEKFEESTIPLFIDIVDINSADEKIKNEIKRDGIVWKN